MKKLLDLQQWARKDPFRFFQQFEEPFFGVCIQIDCSHAYKVSKEKGISFFYITCTSRWQQPMP